MNTGVKISIGAVIILIFIYVILVLDIGRTPAVADFNTCVAAGNPVMESYPRQCRDAQGGLYVEEITGPVIDDMIRVTSPAVDARISSPLVIAGEARGPWFFEASFTVLALDANGKELGLGIAAAQGDWMTTEFVPFTVSLSFASSTTATGTLRFMKNNPSDLRELDASLDIPVRYN